MVARVAECGRRGYDVKRGPLATPQQAAKRDASTPGYPHCGFAPHCQRARDVRNPAKTNAMPAPLFSARFNASAPHRLALTKSALSKANVENHL